LRFFQILQKGVSAFSSYIFCLYSAFFLFLQKSRNWLQKNYKFCLSCQKTRRQEQKKNFYTRLFLVWSGKKECLDTLNLSPDYKKTDKTTYALFTNEFFSFRLSYKQLMRILTASTYKSPWPPLQKKSYKIGLDWRIDAKAKKCQTEHGRLYSTKKRLINIFLIWRALWAIEHQHKATVIRDAPHHLLSYKILVITNIIVEKCIFQKKHGGLHNMEKCPYKMEICTWCVQNLIF